MVLTCRRHQLHVFLVVFETLVLRIVGRGHGIKVGMSRLPHIFESLAPPWFLLQLLTSVLELLIQLITCAVGILQMSVDVFRSPSLLGLHSILHAALVSVPCSLLAGHTHQRLTIITEDHLSLLVTRHRRRIHRCSNYVALMVKRHTNLHRVTQHLATRSLSIVQSILALLHSGPYGISKGFLCLRVALLRLM